MPRFVRKAVTVTAEQWQPGASFAGIVGERPVADGRNGIAPEPASAFVRTRGGTVQVFAGDWIVTMPGPPTEQVVMHDVEFKATYDPEA